MKYEGIVTVSVSFLRFAVQLQSFYNAYFYFLKITFLHFRESFQIHDFSFYYLLTHTEYLYTTNKSYPIPIIILLFYQKIGDFLQSPIPTISFCARAHHTWRY